MSLKDLLKSNRIYDSRGIQRALREIDTNVLAIALSTVSEDLRIPIFRNMTKSSREILEKEISIIEKTGNYNFQYKDLSLEKAKGIVSEILFGFTSEHCIKEPESSEKLPKIDLSTFNNIIETFENIGNHAYANGLISLEGLIDKSDDPFFKKALQLLLDGYEPLLFEELLENYKQRMLESYKVKLSMIIEGVKSMQMGHPPASMKEKLLSLSIE